MLCNACYERFRIKGTLGKSRNKPLAASVRLKRPINKPLAASARRCTYADCVRPDESSQFHQISEGKTAGQEDWSSLVGSVLCHACYERFRSKGTLWMSRNKPLAASARRCSYTDCERPDEGRNFFQISEGKTTGGQDWSSLVGSVLCHACYERFRNKGTLEKSSRTKFLQIEDESLVVKEEVSVSLDVVQK